MGLFGTKIPFVGGPGVSARSAKEPEDDLAIVAVSSEALEQASGVDGDSNELYRLSDRNLLGILPPMRKFGMTGKFAVPWVGDWVHWISKRAAETLGFDIPEDIPQKQGCPRANKQPCYWCDLATKMESSLNNGERRFAREIRSQFNGYANVIDLRDNAEDRVPRTVRFSASVVRVLKKALDEGTYFCGSPGSALLFPVKIDKNYKKGGANFIYETLIIRDKRKVINIRRDWLVSAPDLRLQRTPVPSFEEQEAWAKLLLADPTDGVMGANGALGDDDTYYDGDDLGGQAQNFF